jgi:FkbM family methyltransferase
VVSPAAAVVTELGEHGRVAPAVFVFVFVPAGADLEMRSQRTHPQSMTEPPKTGFTRLRRAAGGLYDARRKPPPGEHVTSYAAQDAKGVPLDLRLGHFLDRRGGFFIEAGANDGLFQSNTALLEKSLDWRGILVEPAPEAYIRCCANRVVPVHNCALVPSDYKAETISGDFDGYPMGSVGGTRMGRADNHTVPARTLQSIIDEHGVTHVDFLSLDAEGYELEILRGCDFTRVSFSFMLIELYPGNYEATVGYLSEAGYDLLGNYSNYNHVDTPHWDGTHNDYLFTRRGPAPDA